MRTTVVIPVFNEVRTLEALVARVAAVPFDKELVLVDDHSTDGSRALLEKLGRDGVPGCARVQVLLQPVNRGKGAALRRGFGAATGEVVVIQDADLEYDPAELPKVLAPIEAGRADVVFGSRFLEGHAATSTPVHRWANQGLTALSNLTTGLRLTDMETCYKAFRCEVLQRFTLREDRFGIEPELTAQVARARVRVVEVPISYAFRSKDEGKKIGWKDGVRAVYAITRYGVPVLRQRLSRAE